MATEKEIAGLRILGTIIAFFVILVIFLGPPFYIWYFIKPFSLRFTLTILYWFFLSWLSAKKIGPWLKKKRANILREAGLSPSEIVEYERGDLELPR